MRSLRKKPKQIPTLNDSPRRQMAQEECMENVVERARRTFRWVFHSKTSRYCIRNWRTDGISFVFSRAQCTDAMTMKISTS